MIPLEKKWGGLGTVIWGLGTVILGVFRDSQLVCKGPQLTQLDHADLSDNNWTIGANNGGVPMSNPNAGSARATCKAKG